MTDAPPADPPVDTPPADPPTDPPVQTPAAGTGDAERDAAFARERRARKEAEDRAKAAEDRIAEAERLKAEEAGEFKELAEKEKARADGLEAKQQHDEQRRNAERSARDMKFKDGDYALYLLSQQGVDFADPVKVREGLESLAKDRTDLVAGGAPAPSGGPAGGAKATPPALTRQKIEGMTPHELARIDSKVIDEALAASQ